MNNIGLLFYGVFEEVLDEIISAQRKNDELVCYLQPYSSDVIKLLRDESPSQKKPIKLYITISDNINMVMYECYVVGWEDKQSLSQKRLDSLNTHISIYQPLESEIYLEIEPGKECKNLVHINNLSKLSIPIDINKLVKVSNDEPCKHRTRGGGHAVIKIDESIFDAPIDDTASDLSEIIERSINSTEKLSLISSRVGQGKFRQSVIHEWGNGENCAVTGVPIKEMLVASHIKPWSECKSDFERLDPANGILLCSHIDKLFDQHLITFRRRGSEYILEVSDKLDKLILKQLGVPIGLDLCLYKLSLDCRSRLENYMLLHNEKFDSKG